jgi:hypothetical protein
MMFRVIRLLAGATSVLAAVAAGIGWLYLLRHAGVLAAGPRVNEALPLQRLAGDDDQPLARVLVAWVPAALVAAAGLARFTRLRRPARALTAGAGAAALLWAAGAMADAVTETEPIVRHLSPQAGRVAIWLPAALFSACALMPAGAGARRAARSAPSADAKRHAAGRAAAA